MDCTPATPVANRRLLPKGAREADQALPRGRLHPQQSKIEFNQPTLDARQRASALAFGGVFRRAVASNLLFSIGHTRRAARGDADGVGADPAPTATDGGSIGGYSCGGSGRDVTFFIGQRGNQ